MSIAFVTTFPNYAWEIYAKTALESMVNNLPPQIPLMVQLDDYLLYSQVDKTLRAQDGIAVGQEKEHADFVQRNKDKDDQQNYRKQAVRFCHKVFAIKRALNAAIRQREADPTNSPRYLIWIDADVVITRPVAMDEIKECLPREGDAVSYLGRKDWDHSECGWLAFDMENGADVVIANAVNTYVSNGVFDLDQWHDSWVWDRLREQFGGNWTNLTDGKPGTEIWEQSPMAKWSRHYKGPIAKKKVQPRQNPSSNFVIQTKNAVPHDQIRANIEANQNLISHWVRECKPTDEEITVVSAGPMLIAEDLREEKGKIIAVKHALKPLKAAGIRPWACILLDPRPHVLDFVQEADKDMLWFVASQVQPEVTQALLEKGCTVWGYHASVGADEGGLTNKQPGAIINGGSATATRGLFLLYHLGFRNFTLHGYDLCCPDKPNLDARDEHGQPKYMEISVGINSPHFSLKRAFWTEPQLAAQFEEVNEIIKSNKFNLKAHGNGIVPFMIRANEVANLRMNELKAKINGTKIPTYRQLLGWNKTLKTKSSTSRRKAS